MKVLVVGGAGYIGSHTVKALQDNGYEVVVYDSLVNGHKESLNENVRLYVGCLSQKDKLETVFQENKIDAVINFAGFIEAGESMKFPLKFFENNVAFGINLLKIMLKYDVDKIIFSSSAAVYGTPKKVPITEEHDKEPINYYGETKLMFEKILEAAKAEGMKSISLRYFNAAGAAGNIGEDHDPETHLIPLVLEAALGKRDHIKIFGTNYETEDGTCIRDYVHVLDLAKAHVIALRGLCEGVQGTFNVGTGKGYSVKEVIQVAKEVTNKEIKVVETDKRPGDPAILLASSDKFFDTFGWKPDKGLKEIISSA